MAITTPPQTIVNESSDSSLNKIYATNTQGIPALDSAATVYITNTQEYVTNYYNSDKASGNVTEVQFNSGSRLTGDSGLTYNSATDSLSVTGNVTAGNIKTDHLLYANGSAWDLGSSSYSNSNVTSYLPTHTGNISAGNVIVVGSLVGSGASPAPTLSGFSSVSAITLTGNLTTAAQPNVTSVGSLTGLTVSNSTGVVNFTTTANVTLGAVGNLHISGGTTGQLLTTNGSGGLSWSTVSSGTTFNGGTVTNSLVVSNTTASTNFSSGAITTTGGLGVAGETHMQGNLAVGRTVYAGHLADFGSWTAPTFIGRNAGADFIQGAIINTNNDGSADWVAYGPDSTDTQGWADMGFTGTTFSDENYTITKANDGYVFVQGMPSAGGNLVLATGSLGGSTHRDIVFATGGFALENEKMRLNHEDSTLFVGAHGELGGTNVVGLDVNGNIVARQSVSISTFVKLTPGTAPSSPAEGMVYYDATAHKLKVYTGSGWETISSAT